MSQRATRIAITLTAVFLFGALSWGQIKPIPKPVSPPSPNPGSAPPVAPNNDRQSIPSIGDVPLPAGSPESALGPFLDGQTIGAVRIDLKDLDRKAIREWVVQGVQELRKNEKEVGRAQGDVGEEFDKLSKEVENFRHAGANQLYWVVSLDEVTADHPPFAVVPVSAGADPAAIEGAFKSWVPAGTARKDTPMPAMIGHTVVFGVPPTIQRLKAAAPARAPRLGLTRAFDAAGNGQIRIALIPQEAPRKAFEDISADLPKELGGGPIQIVSRGLQSMSISIAFPPNPALRILIQSPDAQSAAKLNDVITHAIDWARERQDAPREELAFTQMVGQLKPKLDGDRITIDLPPDDLQKLAATVASGMLQARTNAMRIQVASNLRQLGMAVMMYATDHQGQMPKDLGAEISKYVDGPEGFKRLWVDPLRPNQQKPYVYLKLADKFADVKEPAQAVLIYENHTTWDNGINVAFADGHVEWVADEKQFKEMLDQTKKSNPGAAEMPQ
ncbi:MAG TPA: H-X9-DG-CTERM domain-containing protein [Tepidisphaeraceae bacterium]